MEELKRTTTIEETYGYESFDGKVFDSKAECEKYEKTAEAVICKDFYELITRETGKKFEDSKIVECDIWNNFGYGSEEYDYAIIEIRDETELEIANRFYEIKKGIGIPREYIGKKIFVTLGMGYDNYDGAFANPRTREDLIAQFTRDIDKFFNRTNEEV